MLKEKNWKNIFKLKKDRKLHESVQVNLQNSYSKSWNWNNPIKSNLNYEAHLKKKTNQAKCTRLTYKLKAIFFLIEFKIMGDCFFIFYYYFVVD